MKVIERKNVLLRVYEILIKKINIQKLKTVTLYQTESKKKFTTYFLVFDKKCMELLLSIMILIYM